MLIFFMQSTSCIAFQHWLQFYPYILQGSALFLYFVYYAIFIFDKFYDLVNLLHQFHSNLNVAFFLKPYPFSWFSQFFNGMAAFIQVSLATVILAVSVLSFTHIFLGCNWLHFVPLNYIFIFIEDIFKIANDILCSFLYHIYFTLNWNIFFVFQR